MATKVPILMMVLIILLLEQIRSIPYIKTFEDYLQTGSATPTVTSLNSSNSANYTATFSRSMNGTSYKCALSIGGFDQNYQSYNGDGRYSLIVHKSSSSNASALVVSVSTQLTTLAFSSVQVRYLVIESSFQYLETEHLYKGFTGPFFGTDYGPNNQKQFSRSVSYQLSSSNDQILHFISGYDVTDNNITNDQKIGLSSHCYVQSSSSLGCKVTHYNGNQVYHIEEMHVDVVLYHKQQMISDYQGGSFMRNDSEIYLNTLTQITMETNLSSINSLLFYGVYSFTKNATGQAPLIFNINSNSGTSYFQVTLGNYIMTLKLFWIYFQITINCPNITLWNETSKQCESCLTTQFFVNNSCVDCNRLLDNCTQCSSSSCLACQNSLVLSGGTCMKCSDLHADCDLCNLTSCSSCISPYVLNGTYCFLCENQWDNCSRCNSSACTLCSNSSTLNSTSGYCFMCEDVWPGCTSCTTTQCLSCQTPYLHNVSSCFLCWEQWTNCQDCSVLGCNNCTVRYVSNITNCFLCEDQWANCSECDSSTCLNCTSPYVLNGTTCFLCDSAWSDCTECNASSCLNCTSPQVTNGSDCFLCDQQWPNCDTCDGFSCLNCTTPYQLNITDCFLCADAFVGCDQCTYLGCTLCHYPYTLSIMGATVGVCTPDCSLIANCSSCSVSSWQLICTSCLYNLTLIDNTCIPICGDGFLTSGFQNCDDGNTQNRDGCSSSCEVEQYFSCAGEPSICVLEYMEADVVAMGKSQRNNQVILSIDLFPPNLVLYSQADWLSSFAGLQPTLTPTNFEYDSSTNRLRVALSYSQSINSHNLSLLTNFSSASSLFNLSAITLSLPKSSSNNLALYYYDDSSYAFGTACQYLSWAIAGASVLLILAGYFGCKLQSLEGAAVIQLTALLVMSVQDMSPSFSGLTNLKLSLGVTAFSLSTYYYQDLSTPQHLSTVLHYNSPFMLINIFLIVIIVPLLTALTIKILSATKYKDNYRIQCAWKFALGSFTYYGLMFLAYGEFALLALNLRYFKAELDCLLGMGFGVIFTTLVILWVVASCKYSNWFGCFKKKFYLFEISKYFYLFSTVERFLTALLVICLSPGLAAPCAVLPIFISESVFIVVKKPYALKQWKRPFFNKLVTAVICMLYMGGSLMSADNTINQIIPLVVLALLLTVVVVTVISSIYELREFWTNRQDPSQQKVRDIRPMTVEQAQQKLMMDFQRIIMPTLNLNSSIWQPVKHDESNTDRWKWENYPKLHNTSDFHQLRAKLREQCRMKHQEDEELYSSEKGSKEGFNSPDLPIRRPEYDQI